MARRALGAEEGGGGGGGGERRRARRDGKRRVLRCACSLQWCRDQYDAGLSDGRKFSVTALRGTVPEDMERQRQRRREIEQLLRPGRNALKDATTVAYLYWHLRPESFVWKTREDKKTGEQRVVWSVKRDFTVSNVPEVPPPDGVAATWDGRAWQPVPHVHSVHHAVPNLSSSAASSGNGSSSNLYGGVPHSATAHDMAHSIAPGVAHDEAHAAAHEVAHGAAHGAAHGVAYGAHGVGLEPKRAAPAAPVEGWHPPKRQREASVLEALTQELHAAREAWQAAEARAQCLPRLAHAADENSTRWANVGAAPESRPAAKPRQGVEEYDPEDSLTDI